MFIFIGGACQIGFHGIQGGALTLIKPHLIIYAGTQSAVCLGRLPTRCSAKDKNDII